MIGVPGACRLKTEAEIAGLKKLLAEQKLDNAGRGGRAPTVGYFGFTKPLGYGDEPKEAATALSAKRSCRCAGCKLALGRRKPMLALDRANARWSLDFLSDTISNGRRFRRLAIVDNYTRKRLALVDESSLWRLRVALRRVGLIAN